MKKLLTTALVALALAFVFQTYQDWQAEQYRVQMDEATSEFESARDELDDKNEELDDEVDIVQEKSESEYLEEESEVVETAKAAIRGANVARVESPSKPKELEDIRSETERIGSVDYSEVLENLRSCENDLDAAIERGEEEAKRKAEEERKKAEELARQEEERKAQELADWQNAHTEPLTADEFREAPDGAVVTVCGYCDVSLPSLYEEGAPTERFTEALHYWMFQDEYVDIWVDVPNEINTWPSRDFPAAEVTVDSGVFDNQITPIIVGQMSKFNQWYRRDLEIRLLVSGTIGPTDPDADFIDQQMGDRPLSDITVKAVGVTILLAKSNGNRNGAGLHYVDPYDSGLIYL